MVVEKLVSSAWKYTSKHEHARIEFGLADGAAVTPTYFVRDDGAGFDPARPPALEGEELSEGGLGIAIIRNIADELEIQSEPGSRGSRLRFVKRLHRPS